jgi:hypothetical protein
VITYDSPKDQNTTDLCRYSYGSVITNTVALRELISALPKDLKRQIKEGVKFENCESF